MSPVMTETERRPTVEDRGQAERTERRLEQLEREWDVERVLEVIDIGVIIATPLFALASRRSRWWLVPAVLGGFLLAQSFLGWYLARPVVRKLGVRTPREISRERYTLMSSGSEAEPVR